MTENYSKYLAIFERSMEKVPVDIIKEIQLKLKQETQEEPLVSVVVIAHNEEKHILSCLWSLSENKCGFPIEIIVINNNSTDRTTEILDMIGVKWYNEPNKGPGHARQCGLNHARGKYYLCIDADTIYPPYYIQTMVNQLRKSGVSCAFGLWSFIPDKQHSRLGLFLYESLRDIYLLLQSMKRPELCVRGMAFGFNTEMGRKIGFRTDIIRGEDGSLALAMKQYGKLVLIKNRKARVFTSNSTLSAEGSFFKSFINRFFKAFKSSGNMFSKKTNYKDQESNLIK
ncbi:glycosyltransferase family 2 protein [Bacteroides sedimenti]|uniref:Glycosyl transferase family A n=1 Tax=Bacteroides sedimenti TaxID=2136147 RepID=A0ABN6Z813_9BACE